MIYELPKLPYANEALAPIISAETVHYHFGKHEQAYIDNLNKLIHATEFEDMSLEEIIRTSGGALFNNASQAWNHIFYFFGLSPDGGGEPAGALRLAIEDEFDSIDKFKKEFEESGVKLFGSGWVWLVKDKEGKLSILSGSNAFNPLTKDLIPIMTFDVWEHAYYLDYQNRRADYLHRLWDIVDWDLIESRYLK
ncbi:MAG: superoxide dismutase [Muribaculaceae bacterium]|nr:superoxide dismutase [Muribaculaceae bacterium]